MRPRDLQLAQQIEAGLLAFDRENRPLPGIAGPAERATLVEQMLESIHRVSYVSKIRARQISDRRTDPNDELFDPLKASILRQRQGRSDESFWLVFLFVHFGKHARAGWRYAREVYGRLGGPGQWDWQRTSADPSGFREWMNANHDELTRAGMAHGFGNHRKYESLANTAEAVESYVRWVDPPRTHEQLMEAALQRAGRDPAQAFDDLYRSMTVVARFGRTARFDYLTMVGKLGLSSIAPGSTYMSEATGPLNGARLLFESHDGPASLDRLLLELDGRLRVGMQVLEDALCNWQKSPAVFRPFRG